MGAVLRQLWDLADLLVPERCVVCARGEVALCERCRIELVQIRSPLCARCGAPTAWPVERCSECAGRRVPFASARAAFVYDEAARKLVAGWKERGRRGLTSDLAKLLTEAIACPPVEALAFVPGDRERTLWRGHNTAEALAEALAEPWRLPFARLLTRTGRTPRQRGLKRSERRANVRGAFRATAPAPARVALVDDVYTTGATVFAAATELRRAGARAIHVVTLARAVRR